jgi:lysophospholipase L1-like esterase
LNGVEFVLKDPITGAVKTLTDADLITPSNPTGEYFIGVYAKNNTGGWAACGEPNGTLPNTQGNSYCLNSSFTSPETQQWAVNTGNTRQCFEHFVATNPVQAFVFKPTEQFANDLATQLGEVPPELILPPAVYGVQGREFNLYFDNVVLGSAWDYNVDVSSVGSVGYHLDECWRWTPTGAVTSGNLTMSLSGRASGKQLVSGVTAQRSAASSAGSGTNKKIVYIGDSLINAGVITQTLLDIAATDVMGVTLYGLRGSGANKHEGRGGWSIPDYSTYGRTAYQFTVSGLTTVPTNGATYTHNGSTYTVEWTNITSGSGTITAFLTTGTATPLATGTLTKTGGTGDSSITFAASAAVSGNPFWIGGQVNFAGYLSAFGFPTPDWVFIALGINDVFGQSSDAAAASLAQSRFLQLETLITSIKAANANTRVGIVIPTPPTSSQDAFGFNYTTGQTRWRNKRNVLIWGRELIAKFQNREADRIYVVPSNTALDTVNNYDRSAAAPVNSRATSVLVSRQNNGVHPGATGYQQIGDAVWAFLKYFA